MTIIIITILLWIIISLLITYFLEQKKDEYSVETYDEEESVAEQDDNIELEGYNTKESENIANDQVKKTYRQSYNNYNKNKRNHNYDYSIYYTDDNIYDIEEEQEDYGIYDDYEDTYGFIEDYGIYDDYEDTYGFIEDYINTYNLYASEYEDSDFYDNKYMDKLEEEFAGYQIIDEKEIEYKNINSDLSKAKNYYYDKYNFNRSIKESNESNCKKISNEPKDNEKENLENYLKSLFGEDAVEIKTPTSNTSKENIQEDNNIKENKDVDKYLKMFFGENCDIDKLKNNHNN